MSIQSKHEEGIAAFVVVAKRERVREMVQSQKRRAKFLELLPHFDDWDERCLNQVSSKNQTAEAILRRLKALGAPKQCWVISDDPNLDGRGLPLRDALDAVVGASSGTVISCVPGRLAYYEGEDFAERYILAR